MIHVKANVISRINADASVGGAVKVGGLLNQKVDYNTQVANKPSVNGVTLKGNKTLHDLGIQPEGNYATMSDIPTKVSELENDSGYITEDEVKKYIYSVPCDALGHPIITSMVDHYQFTAEEYVDFEHATISHWFTGGEIAEMIQTSDIILTQLDLSLTPSGLVSKADGIFHYYMCSFEDGYTPLPTYPANTSSYTNAIFVNEDRYGISTRIEETQDDAPYHRWEQIAKYESVLPMYNADWAENNFASPLFILNKPSIPTKTSQLQNDSGFITSSDLPKANTIIAVPFDANGVMLGTPTAYYQFTKREYIDPSTMTVSHWYSADEMAVMGNPYLYCNVLAFSVFPIITDLMHHSHYKDLDGLYLTYDTQLLYSQTYVAQYLMGEAGRCIKAVLVEDGNVENIVKGYLDNILLDADFVQDANYVHIDGVNNNAKQTNAILRGSVDSTSTATAFTATVPSLNALYDGACVYLTNGVITSASGWTLNVNGLGAKPVYNSMAASTRITTTFNVAYSMLFVYNTERVADGCWDMYYGYNSDTNTTAYQVRSNGTGYKAQAKFYRYRLLFEAMDGVHVVPANTSTSTNATTARTPNTAPFNPFGRIFYYSTTTAIEAEALCSVSYLWERYAGITLGYSFAKGSALTMTYPKAVYLKCTPQTDNTVVLDATDPYVQDLPSSEDGSVYIYLGQATSATAIELAENHPVYQYKSGKICLFTGN